MNYPFQRIDAAHFPPCPDHCRIGQKSMGTALALDAGHQLQGKTMKIDTPLKPLAFLALAMTIGVGPVAQAQMGTPAPSGPPSTQPAPKSPSQPSSGESTKDSGGPQITVPLKPTRPLPATSAASGASSPLVQAK
ncbi:MAG: hypothetical protein EOP36_01175 [Rubrivivax sp.]|nr:MAG: hypothetical protein EOP36_01175 [Rubrivivax sp.]